MSLTPEQAADVLLAADTIEEEARILRESHTYGDIWPEGSAKEYALFQTWIALAQRLQKIARGEQA